MVAAPVYLSPKVDAFGKRPILREREESPEYADAASNRWRPEAGSPEQLAVRHVGLGLTSGATERTTTAFSR